jgi:SAM-dependent methyltransferase
MNPHHALQQVSPWVEAHAGLVAPGGTVLDLAAGGGRHSRYFAWHGRKVVAVDKDISALAHLPGVTAIQADLEDGAPWPLAGQVFDAVVVSNYLHRPLFPALFAALRPGGALIYETFARGNEQFGKPDRPDFLLEPNELAARTIRDFVIVAFEDRYLDAPKPAFVQRLAAIKI